MDRRILESGLPILGICYGMQLLARDLGGELIPLEHAEFGPATLEVDVRESFFAGVPQQSRVWMSHGDSVLVPPAGFVALAHTQRCNVAAIGNAERRMYGVQFHSRRSSTPKPAGRSWKTFSTGSLASHRRGRWRSFVEQATTQIREQVGDAKVICALSGGVDSAVAATLVARAIGTQLTCIFVDHGLLRKDEAVDVVEAFREIMHLNVVAVDARERFLNRLAGVVDPEEKRIRIGHEFIAVFDEEAKKYRASASSCKGHSIPT